MANLFIGFRFESSPQPSETTDMQISFFAQLASKNSTLKKFRQLNVYEQWFKQNKSYVNESDTEQRGAISQSRAYFHSQMENKTTWYFGNYYLFGTAYVKKCLFFML